MNTNKHELPWTVGLDNNPGLIRDSKGIGFALISTHKDAEIICAAANALLTPSLVSECGLPKEAGMYLTWFQSDMTPLVNYLDQTTKFGRECSPLIAWFKLPSLPKEDERETAWREIAKRGLNALEKLSAREAFDFAFDAGNKARGEK